MARRSQATWLNPETKPCTDLSFLAQSLGLRKRKSGQSTKNQLRHLGVFETSGEAQRVAPGASGTGTGRFQEYADTLDIVGHDRRCFLGCATLQMSCLMSLLLSVFSSFRIPLSLSKRYLADNSLNKKKERPNRASRRNTSSGERNIKGHMSDGLNFRLLNHKR